MDKRNREIIITDSRSENMLRRLLMAPERERTQRQRWLLLANGGLLTNVNRMGTLSESVSTRPSALPVK